MKSTDEEKIRALKDLVSSHIALHEQLQMENLISRTALELGSVNNKAVTKFLECMGAE